MIMTMDLICIFNTFDYGRRMAKYEIDEKDWDIREYLADLENGENGWRLDIH